MSGNAAIVPVSALDVGYDGDATVSYQDARELLGDFALFGNAFLAKNEDDAEPSHRRICPLDVLGLRTSSETMTK